MRDGGMTSCVAVSANNKKRTNEANNFISKVICIYVGKLESSVPTVGKNINTKQINPIMITK